MAKTGVDLISMADIARLAGQSRATVGNWKSRNPDFPPERGRGPRGPLYDRAEVTWWLESTGQLTERSNEADLYLGCLRPVRGDLRGRGALPLVLLLLAVMSKTSPIDWDMILATPRPRPRKCSSLQGPSCFSLCRRADAASGQLPSESFAKVIQLLSQVDRSDIPIRGRRPAGTSGEAAGLSRPVVLTPLSVRRLVVAIAQPIGTVYDPAAGVGQLMIDAAVSPGSDADALYGQEINF